MSVEFGNPLIHSPFFIWRILFHSDKSKISKHKFFHYIPCAGGTGTTKRKAWDLKGKVSDMEVKMRNYQTKVNSVNQENEVLRGTMVQSQTRAAEIEKELERQRGQIRYQDLINELYHTVVILICLLGGQTCHLFVLRTYEEELQVLSGVRDELETVSSEKMTLQKELSNLEGKYKVMETLRDSQETELQTLKVLSLLCISGAVMSGNMDRTTNSINNALIRIQINIWNMMHW